MRSDHSALTTPGRISVALAPGMGRLAVALKSSGDTTWPWSETGNGAEHVFRATYPAIYDHFMQFEAALRKRQDQGRFWWELRACAYWDLIESPKIVYQDITWRPQFCLDTAGMLSNNTTYFLPKGDRWLAAVLNSPAAWWMAWRTAVHGKDEALRFFKVFVEQFPIPNPTERMRSGVERCVDRLGEIVHSGQDTCRQLLDWLRVEYEIAKPSLKLQSPIDLDSDGFVAEVKKVRGKKKPLTAAGLMALREEYVRLIEPARKLAAEAVKLEHETSDLVNAAYGLTADEVALLWQTAPPRMPIAAARGSRASCQGDDTA